MIEAYNIFLLATSISILVTFKNRLDRPFKATIIYMVLFVLVRHYYIEIDMSSFNDINLDQLYSSEAFMISTCLLLILIAYLCEVRLPKINVSSILITNTEDESFFKAIAFIGFISSIAIVIYRLVTYKTIYVDVSVDPWAGLYSLKIPALCSIISILYSCIRKNIKIFSISILPVFLLIYGEHERAPVFNLIASTLLLLYLSRKINTRIIFIVFILTPIIFQYMTLRRFENITDVGFIELILDSMHRFNFDSILKDAYGRYYLLESTYNLLGNLSRDQENNMSFLYLQSRFALPFFDTVNSFSLSQYVCEAIEPSRWPEGVSCWGYLPAFMLYDSGWLGLFFALAIATFSIYLWSFISVSQSPIVLYSYIFMFPKIIMLLNYTVASFLELFYYFFYILLVAFFSKHINTSYLKSRRSDNPRT